MKYVSWSLTGETGFDHRAVYMESEMDRTTLGDVHLPLSQIFLFGIIAPMVHANSFIHHQR